MNRHIAVWTLSIFANLAAAAPAAAQQIASKYAKDGLSAMVVRGYQDGRAAAPDSAERYRELADRIAYSEGYRQGRQRREDEAEDYFQGLFLQKGGSTTELEHWRKGYDTSFRGWSASPPDKDEPGAHLAYLDGYHAARAWKQGGDHANGDDVKILAEFYVQQLNEMARVSQSFYMSLEAVEGKAAKTPGGAPSLGQSIDWTRVAIERSEKAYGHYLLLERHARAAAMLQPRLVRALGLRATSLLNDIERIESADLRKVLHVDAEKLIAEANRIESKPVTLPSDFREMGRYIRESMLVMSKTLEVDTLRLTLSSGRDDPEALNAALDRFSRFSVSWMTRNITEWRARPLGELFQSVGQSPPEMLEQNPETGSDEPEEASSATFISYEWDDAAQSFKPSSASLSSDDRHGTLVASSPRASGGAWNWLWLVLGVPIACIMLTAVVIFIAERF